MSITTRSPPSPPVVPRLQADAQSWERAAPDVNRWAADVARVLESEIGSVLAQYVSTAEGLMVGPLTLAGDAAAPLEAVPLQQMQASSSALQAEIGALEAAKVDRIGDTMTGPLLLPSGSAVQPALSFSGDPDTGAFHVGPDAIGLATNGVERFRLEDALLTLAVPIVLPGNPAAALEAAPQQYVDAGDRWVQIASVGVTAVPDITITWTPGAYRLVKVYLIGAKPASNATQDLFVRAHRGGTIVNGATDYVNKAIYWGTSGGAVYSGFISFMVLSAGGVFAESVFAEIDLSHADAAERPLITTRTRHTDNLGPTHTYGIYSASVSGGTGLLSGVTVGIVAGSPTFAATGQIVILGLKS